MHGGTLPRWLQGKGIGENIKGKVEVASRKRQEERSTCIIDMSVGKG